MKWIVRPARDVIFADSPKKIGKALEEISKHSVVGVDTEYYGFNQDKESAVGRAKAVSVQLAGLTGPRVFIPLWKGKDPQGAYKNIYCLKEWLEDKTETKVYHNAKADLHIFSNYEIAANGLLGDTMVMDYYAFNGEQHHALKECIRRYFSSESGLSEKILPYTSEDSIDYSDVFRQAKALKKPGKNGEILYGKQTFIPPISEAIRTEEGIAKLIDYSVKDPFFTAVLFEFLKEKLESMPWQGDDNYYEFYRRFALPYTMCLFEMERQGCPVDLEHLKKVSVQIEKDIQNIDFEISRVKQQVLNARFMYESLTKFSQIYESATPQELKELLPCFVEKVTWTPSEIEIALFDHEEQRGQLPSGNRSSAGALDVVKWLPR